MANRFLSKNYVNLSIAGNKVKTDIERILSELGYTNAGLRQTTYSNKVVSLLLNLVGAFKVYFTTSADDNVVIQYPYKKFYAFACKMVHLRRGKVITVVHDLGSFRRKKLSVEKEIAKLERSDVLIIHNEKMKEWLVQQGYTKPLVNIRIFDYLSTSENRMQRNLSRPLQVVYASLLSNKRNSFLFSLKNTTSAWQLDVYGSGLDRDKLTGDESFIYKGFMPSEKLIEQVPGHFGLVWGGTSPDTCTGDFGEYLAINDPHKVSLYIRCHLPIIIWKGAAQTALVQENRIGVCVDSLTELDTLLPAVTEEAYREMVDNILAIDKKLASGYFFKQAVQEAENILKS